AEPVQETLGQTDPQAALLGRNPDLGSARTDGTLSLVAVQGTQFFLTGTTLHEDHAGVLGNAPAHQRPRAALVRRLCVAFVTPSGRPKMCEPATRTRAPALTASGAVVVSMPPSTSSSHVGFTRSII